MAMKYVNKQLCLRQEAIGNIIEEVELLRILDHAFIVNLWYTFQDAEDLFIILEPLLGGDLRFHLNGGDSPLTEEQVRFICAEIGCALDYLRTKNVIHRDVKPENILLDDWGHAHLTDFNVATKLDSEEAIKTLAGTKPYMAPEIFQCLVSPNPSGYSYKVDWWSLGVTGYELIAGRRPFEIHSKTSPNSVLSILRRPVSYPDKWSPEFSKFLQSLLEVRPDNRTSSMEEMKCQKLMANINFHTLVSKKMPPPFVPDGESLNCDPTYELEEMIVESRPLHKKKKRLLRQQSLLTQQHLQEAQVPSDSNSLSQINEKVEGAGTSEEDPFADFPNYNREWERYQENLREKERLWEAELKRLMDASTDEATLELTEPTSSSPETVVCPANNDQPQERFTGEEPWN